VNRLYPRYVDLRRSHHQMHASAKAPESFEMQENYFFELSKYSQKVQEHCATPGAVQPPRAKNEVLGWIEDGCRCSTPSLLLSCN
jgi:methionyl-tRNA synthetase